VPVPRLRQILEEFFLRGERRVDVAIDEGRLYWLLRLRAA